MLSLYNKLDGHTSFESLPSFLTSKCEVHIYHVLENGNQKKERKEEMNGDREGEKMGEGGKDT